jgi:DNA-binding IclR family transcriptional regulator
MPQANHEAGLTQSVLKALDILECLASAKQPLSAQDVARLCGQSRPTAHRLLATLLARGYVKTVQDSAQYQLGSKIMSLSKDFLEHLDLPELARPSMRELSRITNETVHLGILDGAEMLYVAKVSSPQSVRMDCTVGTRNPLHCTAMGKALIASLPPGELDTLLGQITLAPRTPNTITDRAALEQHLEMVRAQGFAIDDVENEEGIRCVGAPIFDHMGRVSAAISVSGPAYRLSNAQLEKLAGTVIKTSKDISSELGYAPGK